MISNLILAHFWSNWIIKIKEEMRPRTPQCMNNVLQVAKKNWALLENSAYFGDGVGVNSKTEFMACLPGWVIEYDSYIVYTVT